MMLLMLIMNLTCTPQRSTGRGKQSGCADRWTFRKALFRHIFFLSSTGWRGKEWRTVRQRWRGRWCEPGPRQCHHCEGSGICNTIQRSKMENIFRSQMYPTRPQSLPQSTTFQSPRPHRRQPQRSPSVCRIGSNPRSWLCQWLTSMTVVQTPSRNLKPKESVGSVRYAVFTLRLTY